MTVIELTDSELRLVREALHAFLDDFGHDEADTLRSIRRVLEKFPDPDSLRMPGLGAGP
jgi:hypothetical protein